MQTCMDDYRIGNPCIRINGSDLIRYLSLTWINISINNRSFGIYSVYSDEHDNYMVLKLSNKFQIREMKRLILYVTVGQIKYFNRVK